jgi:4-hydroxythreonine-4-phosphate dehydrogenase
VKNPNGKSRATLVITPGDPDGIGPEVVAKALSLLPLRGFDLEIHGRQDAFRRLHTRVSKKVRWVEPPIGSAGAQSGESIRSAVSSILINPKMRALVTGPISKERLNSAGFKYPGHTEFLASLSGVKQVSMMLTNSFHSVVLATVHVPLTQVSSLIRPPLLDQKLAHLIQHLRTTLRRKPKIAILGLNPHCGEEGLLGNEEIKTIAPWIQKQKKRRDATVAGPFPADTFFALERRQRRFDGVIAMYHDQGLGPLKAMEFSKTVNVTLGLPFIRTSVDHGTAFDIAGKNKADPSSMIAALKLASSWINKRKS